MASFAYALHTDVCTYLLDEAGVCLWVLSPNPATAAIVEACVGAQFVACLDTRVQGGLSGELLQGASALFVTVSQETGRPILLRTGPIRRVQSRSPGDSLMLDKPLERPRPRLDMILDEDLVEQARAKALHRKSETQTTQLKPEARPKVAGPIAGDPKGSKAAPPPLPRPGEQAKAGPPPLPKTGRRKNEPDEGSITLLTYPGVSMRNRPATQPGGRIHPKAPADDAAPMPLRNKKKKTT